MKAPKTGKMLRCGVDSRDTSACDALAAHRSPNRWATPRGNHGIASSDRYHAVLRCGPPFDEVKKKNYPCVFFFHVSLPDSTQKYNCQNYAIERQLAATAGLSNLYPSSVAQLKRSRNWPPGLVLLDLFHYWLPRVQPQLTSIPASAGGGCSTGYLFLPTEVKHSKLEQTPAS